TWFGVVSSMAASGSEERGLSIPAWVHLYFTLLLASTKRCNRLRHPSTTPPGPWSARSHGPPCASSSRTLLPLGVGDETKAAVGDLERSAESRNVEVLMYGNPGAV